MLYSIRHVFLVAQFLFATCMAELLTAMSLGHENAAHQALSFSKEWQSLGPFRIGTREAAWGADPLEAYGGFKTLQSDHNATFRSPLTTDASVAWLSHSVETRSESRLSHTALLHVEYHDIDWAFLQNIYGWSALQYQVWTRGQVYNHASHSVRAAIYPQGILEFQLNDVHVFGGDFYSFNRAPVVVDLKPGPNVINIRLIREVRAMGGHLPPNLDAQFTVEVVPAIPRVDNGRAILPDLVDGRVPSLYFSVPVTNLHTDWMILSPDDEIDSDVSCLSADEYSHIAPGQTRPIKFKLHEDFSNRHIRGNIRYTFGQPAETETAAPIISLPFELQLMQRKCHESHKYTFLHPSGAVSYAIIKPPSYASTNGSKPLLVNLHGAGLEADSHQVRHMLDDLKDLEAFAIFPTGMSPWSGDDWHVWGIADVYAAIDAVQDWTAQMRWNGSDPLTQRVLISGHSNGGQGTWFFATHNPDRIVAAAPVSGYTSVENYVPYNMWHEAEPIKSQILHTARNSFKHEILLENLLHIPVLQQHGSIDDNVPAYHSRLMSSLRAELGSDSDYTEVAGKNHWWDGAMATQPLKDFYMQYLSNEVGVIEPPSQFALISPAVDEMGLKFGISIEQLISPDRLGRVDVAVSDIEGSVTWHVTPSNVYTLAFDFTSSWHQSPGFVRIAGSEQVLRISEMSKVFRVTRDPDHAWTLAHVEDFDPADRAGSQRGALDAIMRSQGAFTIVSHYEEMEAAVQVSRNLLQYFGADSDIVLFDQYKAATKTSGNIILLQKGTDVAQASPKLNFPIKFSPSGISFECYATGHHILQYEQEQGAIFLRPLPSQRLELVIWGFDAEGLRQAARLMPMLTGVGQSDFIFVSRKTKCQGLAGTSALGFFDHSWSISAGSFLP